jgi:hypothetical protein
MVSRGLFKFFKIDHQITALETAFNHRFIQKSIEFFPKNGRNVCSQTVVFIESLTIKKEQAIKLAKILM